MDRDGMLAGPGVLPCRGCGNGLDADGGHPAERYAGTFTGLCYTCERSQAFDTGERSTSGAQLWSHPPHAPSWRRDRETFDWFPDCTNPKCQHGRIWISRPNTIGGDYTTACPSCWKRHFEHPATVAEAARLGRCVDALVQWNKRVGAEYRRRCEAAGLDPAVRHEALVQAVLADAPAKPTDETCPEFPAEWAPIETRTKRRRKK